MNILSVTQMVGTASLQGKNRETKMSSSVKRKRLKKTIKDIIVFFVVTAEVCLETLYCNIINVILQCVHLHHKIGIPVS